MSGPDSNPTWRKIRGSRQGWKGLCPRCGKGDMFRSWLKVTDKCEQCGLDYRFASPDDGPAFFSLCFVAPPLLAVIVWLQVSLELPTLVLFVIGLPLLGIGCVLPLRPIKGWLVASQFVNKAVEAGTEKLWAEMHEREDDSRNDKLGS
nr:DUF983 domain-containing protein [Erythrobacter litoralis]